MEESVSDGPVGEVQDRCGSKGTGGSVGGGVVDDSEVHDSRGVHGSGGGGDGGDEDGKMTIVGGHGGETWQVKW